VNNMGLNNTILDLGEQVIDGRKNRLTTNLHEFKTNLLTALKAVAKDKHLEVFNLSNDDLYDVIKKRIRVNREAAIKIVSRSNDSNIGTKVALIITTEDNKQVSITYDELTLVQILELDPINTNLQVFVEEIEYLQSLLPKQLDESDIRTIISTNKLSNIKDVMSYFKANYNGQYDSKLLSTIAKSI